MRLFFISILFFSCTVKSNISIAQKNDSKPTDEAEQSGNAPLRVKSMSNSISEMDTVEVDLKDRHYTLYPDGKIAVRLTASTQTKIFHLNTKLTIQTAYFFDYKNDLIVYYTDTDFESGSSFIECYDRKANKMKWKNSIHGFNLTPPIVIDNITYVAAIGLIGKLDLESGQYLWKHDDQSDNLYEKTKFDSYTSIKVIGDKVNFIARPKEGTGEQERIIVDDKTGKIEKIVKR